MIHRNTGTILAVWATIEMWNARLPARPCPPGSMVSANRYPHYELMSIWVNALNAGPGLSEYRHKRPDFAAWSGRP